MKLITWDIEEAIKIFETEDVNKCRLPMGFRSILYCLMILIWSFIDLNLERINSCEENRYEMMYCCLLPNTQKLAESVVTCEKLPSLAIGIMSRFLLKKFLLSIDGKYGKTQKFSFAICQQFFRFFLLHLFHVSFDDTWYHRLMRKFNKAQSKSWFRFVSMENEVSKEILWLCFLQYWRTRESKRFCPIPM